MRTVKVIKDPEAFQLLADESRRRIIFLLRVRVMNVSQIAEELGLSPQTVYHHIQKLKAADMVEVVKEERVGHLIESYYQSTAEVFNCSIGETPASKEYEKKLVKIVVDGLNKLGFKMEYSEQTADEIADAETKAAELKKPGRFEEDVSKLEDADFFARQSIAEVANIVSIPDSDYHKICELDQKIRDLYLSMRKGK